MSDIRGEKQGRAERRARRAARSVVVTGAGGRRRGGCDEGDDPILGLADAPFDEGVPADASTDLDRALYGSTWRGRTRTGEGAQFLTWRPPEIPDAATPAAPASRTWRTTR